MFEDIMLESMLLENDEVETEIISTEDYLNEDDHEEDEHEHHHHDHHCHHHDEHEKEEDDEDEDEEDDEDEEKEGIEKLVIIKADPHSVPVVKDEESDKYYVSAKDVENYMEFACIDDPMEAMNDIAEAALSEGATDLRPDNFIIVGVVNEEAIELLENGGVIVEKGNLLDGIKKKIKNKKKKKKDKNKKKKFNEEEE